MLVLFLYCHAARGAQFVVEQGLPFLRKPFTMREIAGKVGDVLDSSAER
jgi:hypothetical protein